MDRQKIIETLAIPSGYATIRLGIKLHPIQAKILDTLFSKPKMKVCALFGNELGKTTVCGAASILYAIELRNALCISTSATYRQIVKQLIPAMKKYSHLFPKWEFLENSIKVNGETRYVGFQTGDQGRWQGWHGTPERPLYIFTDESAALSDDVFQSISRCNPDILLVAGSPLGPEGIFYAISNEPNMKEKFVHFKMSKFQALQKDGWWINEEDVRELVSMWGESHPLVLSSVYAEFCENIEGGVITLADIEASIRNPSIPDYTEGKHVALDFAAGGDKNVIAFRNGNEVKIIKTWTDKDTMSACYTFLQELDKLKNEYKITASDVSGDADGLGGPMIDRLKQLGWDINRYHGNATATDIQCKNKITDDWINLCKKIRAKNISLPNNQELKLQLTSRKSFMNASGKLQLESKEDMRARGVPSPDIADAVAMCVGKPVSGTLTTIKTLNKEQYVQKYKGYF